MSVLRKLMEISDEPYKSSHRPNDDMDLYILCEGFKYTLREWRKWTRAELEIDEDFYITRGEYSTAFVNKINGILNANGYVLKYSGDSIARRFMHYWLQLYNSNGRCTRLPPQQHNGSENEFENWDGTFGRDFWDNVTNEYVVYKGFDDTEVGYQMLMNIGDFFWNYIDVTRSPAIIERREEDRKMEEEMMRWSDEPIEPGKTLIASKDKTEEVIHKDN